MQKVTNFLEQNVQWVAISLGTLFALWMAWSYIVNSPAKVEVDGQVYTAGELAKHTSETVASDLSSKIVNNTTIAMKVPRPADRFVEAMAWKGTTDQPLPQIVNSLPSEVWKAPAKTDPNAAPGTQQPQTDPSGQPIVANGMATLVMVPTPTADEARVGRSSVVVPPPPPPPVDPNNPNAPQPQPVAPPVDPVTGQPPTVDKEWVTQSFKIDMNQLLDAFKKANIPAGQVHQTAFLHVEIVRQELDGNKNPIGEPQPVKPLEVTANGQAVPPYPGDDASLRQPQAAYEAWAIQNTQHILQPMFYTVVKGDQWLPPGMEAAQQQTQWTLDTPPPGWQDDPAWRDAVMKHRQIQAKERAAQKRQATPRAPTGGGGRRSGGGAEREGGAPGFAPRDTARPAVPPRSSGGFESEGMQGVGTGFPGEGGFAPNVPNMPQPGTAYPTGMFDPAAWKQTAQVSQIQAWGHDVNIVPGKTYQYKMRYRIKNPLYNVGGNVAKSTKDTQIFACISEWSGWSKPVTVPEKTNFFVARGLVAGSSRVQFEVFKWEEGQQHSQIFDVQPGDALGAPMTVGNTEIDFSTGWYLVGVQGTNVLLSDKEGNVKIRNQKTDEGDVLYKQLRELVASAKLLQQQQNPGAVPGVPTVPGAAPGGGIPLPGGR
jgi:hypothetical protein